MKRNVANRLMLMLLCLLISGVISSCDESSPLPTTNGRRDCVVVIGDSIFRLNNNIVPHFQNLSGFRVRRYDVSGSEMKGGMVTNIVAQFRMALRAGHVRTLIMDGGGNDFIISGLVSRPRQEVNDAYKEIFDLAAENNVENIVVMGYYRTNSTSNLTDASETDVRNLTLGYARDLGLNAAHFDPSEDQFFSSKRPGQYTTDSIHPTTAAGHRLAELIWETMQENDMEQDGGC